MTLEEYWTSMVWLTVVTGLAITQAWMFPFQYIPVEIDSEK